jgi:hypothetical protein
LSIETLEAHFESIRQAAQDSASFVVDAVLSSEHQEGFQIVLPLDSFIGLLKSCKPRVIYAFANPFNTRDALSELLLASDDEADDDVDGQMDEEGRSDKENRLLADARVAALVEAFEGFDGQIESFIASFVVEGVLHTVYEKSDWAENFQNGVDELNALLRVELTESRGAEYEVNQAKTRECAQTLSTHPKFIEGRPSREKREYLARSLFPELSESEIFAIVDEATNMQWLNSR